MHQKAISAENESIVCLPNRVVVTVTNSKKEGMDGWNKIVLFVIYLVPYLVIGYDIVYKAARHICISLVTRNIRKNWIVKRQNPGMIIVKILQR